jgi:hypothetical protein
MTMLMMACTVMLKKYRGLIGEHELEIRDEGLLERTDVNESLHQQEETERTEVCFSVSSVSSGLIRVMCLHKFAPGRIKRLMPSVTFISWKLISSPSGTSSSFM